ncbi:MAG: YceD family protein [Burkholderiaceae bacterium]
MSLTADPFSLARKGTALHGPTPIREMPRLLDALSDQQNIDHLDWQASFEKVGESVFSPVQMHLTCNTELAVDCVRCLEPIPTRIAVDCLFRLVRDDNQAARLDNEATEYDVIAVDQQWHILDVLEDELLLALPAMPRHENCQNPHFGVTIPKPEVTGAPDPATPEEDRQFPFANLADKLKSSDNK